MRTLSERMDLLFKFIDPLQFPDSDPIPDITVIGYFLFSLSHCVVSSVIRFTGEPWSNSPNSVMWLPCIVFARSCIVVSKTSLSSFVKLLTVCVLEVESLFEFCWLFGFSVSVSCTQWIVTFGTKFTLFLRRAYFIAMTK